MFELNDVACTRGSQPPSPFSQSCTCRYHLVICHNSFFSAPQLCPFLSFYQYPFERPFPKPATFPCLSNVIWVDSVWKNLSHQAFSSTSPAAYRVGCSDFSFQKIPPPSRFSLRKPQPPFASLLPEFSQDHPVHTLGLPQTSSFSPCLIHKSRRLLP